MRLQSNSMVALLFAAKLHRQQPRKGTQIPYLGHLLAVAALVIEDRGSEDEAVAALLHDSLEDQGNDYPSGRRCTSSLHPRPIWAWSRRYR